MTLKIFGAGMAGLLAAHILKARDPIVFELQPELPDNHSALLRFRTNAVAEATGIPFRKVNVQKALWDGKKLLNTPTLRHNNQYSLKVTGRASGRSILNLAPAERYIAPEGFLKRLATGLDIRYGRGMTLGDEGVSTIPMPALASLLGVSLPFTFEAKKIWTETAEITSPDVDLFQTVYFSDPDDWLYRASFTGKRLTLEYIQEPKRDSERIWNVLEKCFGIRHPFKMFHQGIKSQKFGKLLPVDDEARRSFIMYASDKHRIYSAGRFATWRQILLDDVVNDVHVIDRIMNQVDRYGMIKELTK